jgi:hypothetical protein
MRKLLTLVLAASLSGTAFAQPSTLKIERTPTWLVEAGVLYRINKLCGNPAAKEDMRVVGDVLLATSVNPRMVGFEGTDAQLLADIRQPPEDRVDLVQVENSMYQQVVSIIQTKHELEGSVCNPSVAGRVATFVQEMRDTGIAKNATRLADIMVKNGCVGLGKCLGPVK